MVQKHIRNILVMVFIILITAVVISGSLALGIYVGANNPDHFQEILSEEEIIEHNPMDEQLRKTWMDNKQINQDYIGQISFDSGLVNLSFVQAKSVYKTDGSLYTFYDENGHLISNPEGYCGNDVYLWTNWKTGEYDKTNEGGSVFLDYRNNLDDQNLIVFGHHFARDYDPSGSKQFTPLDVLLNPESYEENKTLKLILDNEIREYIIANVFIVSVYDEDGTQFMRTDFNYDLSGNADPGYGKTYLEYISSISKYKTDVEISEDDNFLTLVTCIQHQPDYRQVILCKELSRETYSD